MIKIALIVIATAAMFYSWGYSARPTECYITETHYVPMFGAMPDTKANQMKLSQLSKGAY